MCFLQNEAPFFLLVFKRRGAFWAADFCTKHFAHAEFNSKQTFFFSRYLVIAGGSQISNVTTTDKKLNITSVFISL